MKLLRVESETYETHVTIDLDEVYAIEALYKDGSYNVVAYLKNSNMEADGFYIIYGEYAENHDYENEAMESDILSYYKAIIDFWCSNDKMRVISDKEAASVDMSEIIKASTKQIMADGTTETVNVNYSNK